MLIKSLVGVWKEEYLFMLEQAVQTYEFHQQQIKKCEEKIKEQLLKQVAIVKEGDITSVSDLNTTVSVVEQSDTESELQEIRAIEQTPQVTQEMPVSGSSKKKKVPKVPKVPKVKKAKKNQFDFSLINYLIVLTGVDLCKIPGIGEVSALEFISEVGTDMSKWKSAKHFAAWLNLVPNTKVTGGKVISSKMMKKKNKAGQYLKQAASTLANSKSPLGDYYRKMRARLGGKGAVVATAHKLARIIYTMLSTKREFNVGLIKENEIKSNEDKIKKLEKQIERLKKAA